MFTELKIPAGRRPMTASEVRISVIAGSVFSLMILVEILGEYSPGKLSVLFFFLFWVPMLILHELGHALTARLVGWRVGEIVIGFGRDLWQFQLGETRIRIKLAPVEGYVLPAPRETGYLRLKCMLVYAGGPGAELLLLGVLLLIFGSDVFFDKSGDVYNIALQSLALVILFGAGFNLLPFRVEGAVSDGLGIISSPFISDESIELRLLTFELQEIREMLARGETGRAVESLKAQIRKYPENDSLQWMFSSALSMDGQDDLARDLTRKKLLGTSLTDSQRYAWLHLQAQVELDAEKPSYLVLDLALQKAFAIVPDCPALTVTKGASLVLRGQYEQGGNLIARAWRRSEGKSDDARMLAYLTIAAHRCGDPGASEHFKQAFEAINRSAALHLRVDKLIR
ncbi:MAG: hypothetical protein GXP15_10890 [Gammaproteobacteria bacterium]|nr:hypothetical protein [Gammaproteobacteria bacterium]